MDRQLLHFNHHFLDRNAFLFENAVTFVTAHDLCEVEDAIIRIEQYIKKGYYAVGYISYEAASAFNNHMKVFKNVAMPLVHFGIYDRVKEYKRLNHYPKIHLQWELDTSKREYQLAIEAIHEAIKKGLTYQVNYTVRLLAKYETLNTMALYEQLKRSQKADYTCHLSFDDYEIISLSPELFFAWDGDIIETKPMKGTIKRGLTFEDDLKQRNTLKTSTKDRAENVMIVDLLRNDLSRIAQKGSVKVEKLFELEQYPTVYQLTSTVTAKTKKNISLLNIFKSLFPCGSITGAPKISTMEIINKIEKSPREVYCGAIGMITPEHKAIFNVPIRTIWIDQTRKQAVYGVGGGITWDSTVDGEFNEVLAKTNVLKKEVPQFELLETMKLENGYIYLRDLHIARLKHSADYFQIPVSISSIKQELDIYCNKISKGIYKLRLIVNSDGTFQIEKYELTKNNMKTFKIKLSNQPIDQNNIFHYHKTTYRDIYEQPPSHFDDILLWNEEGYCTEFVYGNLVYQLDGTRFTPPIKDGLLPGTKRQYLIEKGEIKERSLHKSELKQLEQLWLINSVRGWINVTEIVY